MSRKIKAGIPEDMAMDILLRLPVKSLLRFRCVSKPWCSLVQNPNFITNHYLNQINAANASILVQHCDSNPFLDNLSFSLMISDREGGHEIRSVKEHIRTPFLYDTMDKADVLGPCNGLLCFHGFDEKIVLWNPATREVKPLPPSPINRLPFAESVNFGCLGFGFDSKTSDYKVLRFVANYYNGGWSCVNQVELYTLSSNSWRELPTITARPYGNSVFNTYMDGFYHWVATRKLIVSFDMANEVFSSSPLPDCWDEFCGHLMVFDESLAIISYSGLTEICLDIWVMKEYGVKDSWTKHLSIGPIYGVERPLGFWKNRGLFLEDSNGQLVLYDPRTQEIMNMPVCAITHYLVVIFCVESLVPINGRPEHEDDIIIRTQSRIGDA